MYCRKCGTKLPDDALFCVNCGEKVVQNKDILANSTNEKNDTSNTNVYIIGLVILAIISFVKPDIYPFPHHTVLIPSIVTLL